MTRLTVGLLMLALLIAPAATAKKKPAAPTTAPTVTATYDAATNHISFAGCGWDYAILETDYTALPSLTITEPDGEVVSYVVGLWSTGCLDNAYITAQQSGTYAVTVDQAATAGPLHAETTVTVP